MKPCNSYKIIFITAISLLYISFPSDIFSQETKSAKAKEHLSDLKKSIFGESQYIYTIQWEDIEGNNGYAIEVKDKNNKVLELQVLTNTADLALPIGNYQVRISPLSKRKKPYKWSPWSPFTVDKETAKPKRNIWGTTAKIIPCIGFFNKHKPIWGSTCLVWSAGLGAAFYIEKKAGDRLAEKEFNDPFLLTYLSYSQPILFSLKLMEDKRKDKKNYDRHQNNQRAIGAAAGISYLAYVFYMFNGFGLLSMEAGKSDIRERMEWRIEEPYYADSNPFEYRYTHHF